MDEKQHRTSFCDARCCAFVRAKAEGNTPHPFCPPHARMHLDKRNSQCRAGTCPCRCRNYRVRTSLFQRTGGRLIAAPTRTGGSRAVGAAISRPFAGTTDCVQTCSPVSSAASRTAGTCPRPTACQGSGFLDKNAPCLRWKQGVLVNWLILFIEQLLALVEVYDVNHNHYD